MGFFKNIGKAIKKVTKKISFNNVIKLASNFDPTGISGGAIAAVEAKKDEKKALEAQKKAQLEYDKQVAADNQALAKQQLEIMQKASQEAEYQRQIVASNTQAIGGKVGIIAGSITGQIGQAALQSASQQVNQDLQTGIARAGATMANSTLNEWLKMHWWKLLIGLVALGFGLRFLLGGSRR